MNALTRCLWIGLVLTLFVAVVRAVPLGELPPRPLADPLPLGGRVRPLHWVSPGAEGRLAVAARGNVVAVGCSDGKVAIMDLETGKERCRFRTPDERLTAVAISADGQKVATASKTLRLWDATTGASLRQLVGHTGQVHGLAFAPDDKLLASAGEDRSVRLWDVATGKQKKSLRGPNGEVCAVAFAPDGKTLASGGEDQEIHIWDVNSGKERRQCVGHANPVKMLAFLGDGATLVSTCGVPDKRIDRTLRIWDASSGKELRRFPSPATAEAYALSPDGKTLATFAGGKGGSIVGLDLETGHVVFYVLGGDDVFALAFTPDGKSLVAAGAGELHPLQVWEFSRTPRSGEPVVAGTRSVAVAPNGKSVATLGTDDVVRCWDAATGQLLQRFDRRETALAVGYDRRGRLLLAHHPADDPNQIYVTELATGAVVARLSQAITESVYAFSPDGRRLASAGGDAGVVELWDLENGLVDQEQRLKPLVIGAPVVGLAFSADAATLAVSLAPQKERACVQVWDVGTGALRRPYPGLYGCQVLAYAPTGHAFAVAGPDAQLRIVEVATGETRRELTSLDERPSGAAFGPDGRLVTIGARSAALVWSMKTNLPPARIDNLEGCWDQLAAEDARTASRAMQALTATPGRSVPLLAERLTPILRWRQLPVQQFCGLDDADGPARARAQERLETLGELALPEIHAALTAKPPLEIRLRLETMLRRMVRQAPEREALRLLRALEVLETIDTPEARALVAALRN